MPEIQWFILLFKLSQRRPTDCRKQITEIKKRIKDNKELIQAQTRLKNSLKTTENKKAIQTY